MITDESRTFFVYKLPLIRGFCILGVILIHTTQDFYNMTQFGWLFYTLIFLNNFARFAVPLFIVFSGFYLSLNPRNEKTFPFYSRTLRFLIVPYILYSLLYSILKIRGGDNPWHIITDLPLASAAGHLWFGLLILQLYFLHPLLRRLYLACNNRGVFLIVALLMQIIWNVLSITLFPFIWSNLSTSLFPDSITQATIMSMNANKFTNLLFFGYIGYFIAGYYLLDHSDEISRFFKRSLFSIFGAIAWIALSTLLATYWCVQLTRGAKWNAIEYQYLFHFFLTPLLSFAALGTILSLAQHQNKLLRFFSQWFHSFGLFSYGIYYLHIFFILLFTSGFIHLVNPHPLYMVSYYVMKFIVVSFVTFLAVKIMSRLPFGKYVT